RRHLSLRLQEYMVPSAYVRLDVLPLTVNGKVDRKALPAPQWGSREVEPGLRTPVEEIMSGIWADVLDLEAVRRDGDFFALGGHSLLAMRVRSRVREVFQTEVPLRWLFETPVLSAFTARLSESGEKQTQAPLVRREREERLSLSFAQQRLWFIDQLEPGSSAYNVRTALRMSGSLDIHAVTLSFSEVVRRHEVLRTVFVAE